LHHLPYFLQILPPKSPKKENREQEPIDIDLEKEIQKGEIIQGQSHSLFPKESSIELGDNEITYKELADWLKELDSISEIFATYFEGDA